MQSLTAASLRANHPEPSLRRRLHRQESDRRSGGIRFRNRHERRKRKNRSVAAPDFKDRPLQEEEEEEVEDEAEEGTKTSVLGRLQLLNKLRAYPSVRTLEEEEAETTLVLRVLKTRLEPLRGVVRGVRDTPGTVWSFVPPLRGWTQKVNLKPLNMPGSVCYVWGADTLRGNARPAIDAKSVMVVTTLLCVGATSPSVRMISPDFYLRTRDMAPSVP